MNLGLEVLRTRGRAAQAVTAEAVRELVPDELLELNEERGVAPKPITRLATRHHALARALASGMPDGEAALMVGLTQSRVSILKDDPAFRELMEFYRKDLDRVFHDVHESLAAVSYDAIELIRERLEESPEKVSTGQLLEIAKMGADRTGFGPQSSQTNLNVNVDLANRLEAARRRVRERKGLLKGNVDDSGHVDITGSDDGTAA